MAYKKFKILAFAILFGGFSTALWAIPNDKELQSCASGVKVGEDVFDAKTAAGECTALWIEVQCTDTEGYKKTLACYERIYKSAMYEIQYKIMPHLIPSPLTSLVEEGQMFELGRNSECTHLAAADARLAKLDETKCFAKKAVHENIFVNLLIKQKKL